MAHHAPGPRQHVGGMDPYLPEALAGAGDRGPEQAPRIPGRHLHLRDPGDRSNLPGHRRGGEVHGGVSQPDRGSVAQAVRQLQEPVREPAARFPELGRKVDHPRAERPERPGRPGLAWIPTWNSGDRRPPSGGGTWRWRRCSSTPRRCGRCGWRT